MTESWLLASQVAIAGSVAGCVLDLYVAQALKRLSARHLSAEFQRQNLAWLARPAVLRVFVGERTLELMKARTILFPTIETLCAVFVCFTWCRYGFSSRFLLYTVFAGFIVPLFVIPLRTPERGAVTPNTLTLGGIAIGLLLSGLPGSVGVSQALLGLMLGSGILFGIGETYLRLRGVEGMGMGSIKMLGMIGAFLGWKNVLVVLVLSSLSGAAVGFWQIRRGAWDMKHGLPFSSFLAIAALIAALAGDALLQWYVSLSF